LRSLLGLTRLDNQSNTTIREKLKAGHIVDEIRSYENNWLQHVKRMEHSRIPRIVPEYKPKGKRNIVRPKNKMQRPTGSSRLSSHRTGPRCPTSVYVHDDDVDGDVDVQVIQNKYLRVITQSPRCTPISYLHYVNGIDYLQPYILSLANRFYSYCPEHYNPLIRFIANYPLQDLLKLYKKYKHQRPKHILL
jgi:hypothetical protein